MIDHFIIAEDEDITSVVAYQLLNEDDKFSIDSYTGNTKNVLIRKITFHLSNPNH